MSAKATPRSPPSLPGPGGRPPDGVALPPDEIRLRDRGALRRGRLPVVLGAVPRRLGG